MRLSELHVKGFGKLLNQTVQFSPGLNLIFGPNEAGKSTLQRSILALFYGFFDEGTITGAKRATLSAFQPWDTRLPYAGSLRYVLDDGQSFRVERTFAPKLVTSLYALPQNNEISSRFRSASQGRLFFADEHLGMSYKVFEKTSYVRQADLVALESSADVITDTLMRLSTSATTDTTATEAIALLEDLMKESIGTARARTKPLPIAQERLATLEAERSEVVRRRTELFSQIAELKQTEEQLQRLDLRCQQLRYLLILAETQVATEQFSNANAIADEIHHWSEERTRWAAWAAFPEHLHSEVVGLAIHRRNLQKEMNARAQQASGTHEQLLILEAQVAALEQHIALLTDSRDVLRDELPHVQELASQWRSTAHNARAAGERWQKAQADLGEEERQLAQTRSQVEPVITLGLSELAALRQRLISARHRADQARVNVVQAQGIWDRTGMDDAQFQQLEQMIQAVQDGALPAPSPRKGCRSILTRQPLPTPSKTPTEFVIYADVKPIHANFLQTRAEADESQRILAEIETSVIDQLNGLRDVTPDERGLAELSQRLERYLQREAVIGQQRTVVAQLRTEFDEAEQDYQAAHTQLRNKLVQLGAGQNDTQIELENYLRRCEQRTQFERNAAQLEQLRFQMGTLRRENEATQTRQLALDEAEDQLRTLLSTAGINLATATIEEALARFGEGVTNHKHWTEVETAYQAASRHQQSLAGNRMSVDQVQSLTEMTVRFNELRAAHPEWLELRPDKTAQEYNQLIWQADKELADARQENARLKDGIRQSTTMLRHLAEIDETIAAVRRQIQQLERLRDALAIARIELEQTARDFQRQFAPHLEVLTGEGLNRATQSRYQDVQIDPSSLSVMLRAPETGDYVSVQRLSTGTRDMVYLMLRVSIVRLMSRSQERLPLLLDDPLVQCDYGRQIQALEFLSRLAEETQILLFTKDEATRMWFEQHFGASQMHRLHVLQSGGMK